MTDLPVLACEGVRKHFEEAGQRLDVLRGIELRIARGETVAIIGASGSGKTTLLQILGGLDLPTSGTVRILGAPINRMGEAERGNLRNRALGFVYQFHHLLPEFSALENVAMPLLIGRWRASEAFARAGGLLTELGLAERVGHRPGALSGGEQQRVAVARALAASPRVLLADEPTGNLDSETGARLHELLRRLNEERRLTVVVVTHNESLANACDRTLRLLGGRLEALAAAQ
jgi:lipoprotein-releasing system ATP-binding protein